MLKDEQELWVVRDTIFSRSGEKYGKKWKIEVIMTPMAMYYARVQVVDITTRVLALEFVGLFADDLCSGQEKATQAGYKKLADMMPKPTEQGR